LDVQIQTSRSLPNPNPDYASVSWRPENELASLATRRNGALLLSGRNGKMLTIAIGVAIGLWIWGMFKGPIGHLFLMKMGSPVQAIATGKRTVTGSGKSLVSTQYLVSLHYETPEGNTHEKEEQITKSYYFSDWNVGYSVPIHSWPAYPSWVTLDRDDQEARWQLGVPILFIIVAAFVINGTLGRYQRILEHGAAVKGHITGISPTATGVRLAQIYFEYAGRPYGATIAVRKYDRASHWRAGAAITLLVEPPKNSKPPLFVTYSKKTA
jgi:hypothetical protein